MMMVRLLTSTPTWAAVALAAAGLVALGSAGVANAYPPPNWGSAEQRDQDEPAHGYADAVGGQAEPMNWAGNWLFGNGIPRGNYGVVASPSAGLDVNTFSPVAVQSVPIVMPAGSAVPAPLAPAPVAPGATAQGAQPTIPAPLAMPIGTAGATG